MSIEFTGKELEDIEQYAQIGFSWREIAKVLGIHAKSFFTEWSNERSLVREAYDRGCLMTKVDLETKRTEYAINGNITTMQQLDRIHREREFEDLKDKHLYHE